MIAQWFTRANFMRIDSWAILLWSFSNIYFWALNCCSKKLISSSGGRYWFKYPSSLILLRYSSFISISSFWFKGRSNIVFGNLCGTIGLEVKNGWFLTCWMFGLFFGSYYISSPIRSLASSDKWNGIWYEFYLINYQRCCRLFALSMNGLIPVSKVYRIIPNDHISFANEYLNWLPSSLD